MRMTGHMVVAIVATAAVMAMTVTRAAAQTPAGTAFSYQGRLTDGGAPASGLYDLRFTLYDAASGGAAVVVPVVVGDVTVTSGLFTVLLDFGPVAFSGDARWLEIAVRPGASSGDFTPLASRQQLTPSPHAVFSQHSRQSLTSEHADAASTASAAPWTGITGKPAGFVDDVDNDTLATLACTTPGFVAKWTGTAWSCALDGDATGLDWKLTGNGGTFGAAVLGTTDPWPLTLIVNGSPALRITSIINAPSLIGGHSGNTGAFDGATIAGGGSSGSPNRVTGNYGAIGGGVDNEAAQSAVVGGGASNHATGNVSVVGGGNANVASRPFATVGGGSQNNASRYYTTISGGELNRASADYATVGGGSFNEASNSDATVGGGAANIASGMFATVPGGAQNVASGQSSFAAGHRANAAHDGAFVWADTQATSFSSPAPATFSVRAAGGIWFGTTGPADIPGGQVIATSTGAFLSTGGNWVNASDRNVKEGFAPIDGTRLLDQLARLPITSWSYKAAPGVRHIGPMAQDFMAAFNVGDSDKAISTIDPAGIALATIQELHRRIEAQAAAQTTALAAAEAHAAAQDARLATQDAQIAALQAMVRELQHVMSSRSPEGVR